MATIFIALGSNLGDRLEALQAALAAMPPGVAVLARSPVYETSPWGGVEQGDFLNMVIRGTTALPPLRLLEFLKGLEQDLGRIPAVRYGPRRIDLDILFYDDLVLETPRLCLPHPRLHERAFVLVPLADLAPEHLHPLLSKTVTEMLAQLDTGGVRRYEPIT